MFKTKVQNMLMKETQRNLINNLVTLMDARGWTAKELSEASGVSKRMVAYIVSGERAPSISIADDLAKAFGLEGWHLIMPNLTRDILTSSAFSELLKNYTQATDEGRDLINKIADREAVYGKSAGGGR